MSASSRLAALAGVVLLGLGLAACGGSDEASDNPSPPMESYPVDEPSDMGEGDEHGPSDMEALVGEWELVPTEPHTKTPLTVTDEGTAEVPAADGALETRGYQGTVEPDGAGGFTIMLTSTDAELMEWTLTLKPGAQAETFDVTDEKGATYTLVKA
ncbi:hypothetical protein AB0I28_28905 [Phytomonospora sp. NPDC050363]|uniref:hypothetical protein n=1 Tax=Phytomonospora sp. NPDC050363 TaxID=3155642 RepID=UPI003411A905